MTLALLQSQYLNDKEDKVLWIEGTQAMFSRVGLYLLCVLKQENDSFK